MLIVAFAPSPERPDVIPTGMRRSPTWRKTMRRFARRAAVARIASS